MHARAISAKSRDTLRMDRTEFAENAGAQPKLNLGHEGVAAPGYLVLGKTGEREVLVSRLDLAATTPTEIAARATMAITIAVSGEEPELLVLGVDPLSWPDWCRSPA
jgi:hypothetical protein